MWKTKNLLFERHHLLAVITKREEIIEPTQKLSFDAKYPSNSCKDTMKLHFLSVEIFEFTSSKFNDKGQKVDS